MTKHSLTAIPALFLLAAPAAADDFSYEVSVGYAGTEDETVIQFQDPMLPGLPPPPATVTLKSDSDQIALRGTWYFDGLSDAKGPRSAAAFVDRASSLSLSYTDGTIELPGVMIFNVFPAVIPTTDVDTQSFDANARYVWKDNGWFVTGGASFSEVSAFGDDLDASAVTAGVGKYLGETTTLQLSLVRSEFDTGIGSDSDTGVALSGRHIGDLGDTWQYGVSATASDEAPGGGDGSYDVGFSVYPNRDITLGFSINGALGADGPFDSTGYELSGGWFATPNLSLSAGYNWVDIDEPPGQDTDVSGFVIDLAYRF